MERAFESGWKELLKADGKSVTVRKRKTENAENETQMERVLQFETYLFSRFSMQDFSFSTIGDLQGRNLIHDWT
jgi:hypothetical protein